MHHRNPRSEKLAKIIVEAIHDLPEPSLEAIHQYIKRRYGERKVRDEAIPLPAKRRVDSTKKGRRYEKRRNSSHEESSRSRSRSPASIATHKKVITIASPHEEHYKHTGICQPRILKNMIKRVIETVVRKLANYDPMDVEYDEQIVSGHEIKIKNLHAEGFSNVVASHIKVTGSKTYTLELEMEAPQFLVKLGNWKVDGKDFYGQGDASGEIHNFKVTIKSNFNLLAKKLHSLNIVPYIGSASVVLRGIFNNPKLSQKISNDVTEYLNYTFNNDCNLHKKISEFFLKLIEKILEKFRT